MSIIRCFNHKIPGWTCYKPITVSYCKATFWCTSIDCCKHLQSLSVFIVWCCLTFSLTVCLNPGYSLTLCMCPMKECSRLYTSFSPDVKCQMQFPLLQWSNKSGAAAVCICIYLHFLHPYFSQLLHYFTRCGPLVRKNKHKLLLQSSEWALSPEKAGLPRDLLTSFVSVQSWGE